MITTLDDLDSVSGICHLTEGKNLNSQHYSGSTMQNLQLLVINNITWQLSFAIL